MNLPSKIDVLYSGGTVEEEDEPNSFTRLRKRK
ncbi:uncharacterized protein G2W53_032986 [Senna tora]|uniref:Uncharacterized protein n=1 Tax=Senna tora TaxID=362788 RepID=A0A834SZY2_9FABA|nr:uncharacterized protein G2W53_032986 [Senna tora]